MTIARFSPLPLLFVIAAAGCFGPGQLNVSVTEDEGAFVEDDVVSYDVSRDSRDDTNFPTGGEDVGGDTNSVVPVEDASVVPDGSGLEDAGAAEPDVTMPVADTGPDVSEQPLCGNGVIDDGETCDPPGSCPTSCDSGHACARGTLTGSAATCDARCTYEPVAVCVDGDGCCPAGCNATNDSDCFEECQPDGTSCLTEAEQTLFDAINAYRAEHDLPPVPLSYSLTIVARAHVEDLNTHGSTVLTSECNMHSWSPHGTWTACCYTRDHAQAACMWNKPSELTNYRGHGFEISAGTGNPLTALSLWKGSAGHNNVILNRSAWANYTWRAIGIGVRGGYAHVWFGAQSDPDTF